MIGKYLIHCYLYYICNHPVISDEEFDKICKDLLDNWDSIEHMHKHLVSREDLEAGTGFTLKFEDYPEIVKSCASRLVQEHRCLNKWDRTIHDKTLDQL